MRVCDDGARQGHVWQSGARIKKLNAEVWTIRLAPFPLPRLHPATEIETMTSHARPIRSLGSRFISLAFSALVFGTGLACAEDAPKAVIEPVELVARLGNRTAPFILDVRAATEYAAGHIPGAINISHDELAERISELPEDKNSEIAVYCQSGRRAGLAESVLREDGFTRVRDLAGHWKAWSGAGRPTEASQ